MSNEKGLRFYEQEWEKEHALRIQAEQRAERTEEELANTKQYATLLESKVERANRLLEEAEDAQSVAVTETEKMRQLLAQYELETQKTTTQLREELAGIKLRINQHDFWRKEFAQLLAADLDNLDKAVDQISQPREWITVFEHWHILILNGLLELSQGKKSSVDIQQLRQFILAQWVYTRWLELFGPSEDEVGQ